MGIYYDHGVQYMVMTKSGEKVIVVNIKKADGRLVETEYYNKRKDEWFASGGSFCRLIADGELDMELLDDEKTVLDSVLRARGDDVVEHGWYDVQYVYDTYGF